MSNTVMLMWAGGKESALAYKKLVDAGEDVTKLCVLTDEGKGVYNEVLLGVRTQRNYIPIEIIQAQADSMGVELVQIKINDIVNLRQYYDSLAEWALKCQEVYVDFKENHGGTAIAFGYFDSMCLESKNVGLAGLEALYPLMGMTEEQIVSEVINSGFKAKIVRTNPNLYGMKALHELCGQDWNQSAVDLCIENEISPIGEDGSLGTVCYDGPIFSSPININYGEPILFDVDEVLSTSKIADMNAFNVLQTGATRNFLSMSI